MKDRIKNEVVRTLGMYQPYASLMLHGKIETRWVQEGKKPPFPLGLYLLYATKKSQFQDFAITSGKYRVAAMEVLKDEVIIGNGSLVAIGDLINLRLYDPATDGPKTFVDSFDGRMQIVKGDKCINYVLWCLEFESIHSIKKYFRFKGKQGVGKLDRADKDKIILS